MIKNYIKVAFRNLIKNKAYAAINILGLALGLMVSLIVFLYVQEENGYEKHISDYNRIYRIGINANMLGQVMDGPISPSPAAQTLRNDFAEVESATRFRKVGQEILLRNEQTKFYINDGGRADSLFFDIFDYQFIYGDPKEALKDPNSIVLSEETAIKFFDSENPMGKIINYDNRRDLIVTGVYIQPEGNSHFTVNFLIPENNITPIWVSNNFYTYLKLKEGVNPDEFLVTMQDHFMSFMAPQVEQYLKINIEQFLSEGNSFNYDIQPITDIHLHSQRQWELEQNGNVIYLYIFIGIALLVILIAGINFMNIATARSAKRAKEVGIRKISGASKTVLISQFLVESLVQSFIALLLAFVMLELIITGFNNIMETNLKLLDSSFVQTLVFALVITILYGLFAGSYPAFFLSSFQPVKVLKGDMAKSKGGILFRKILVVIQFTGSIILIIGMMIIFSQISYMHNKDVGFKGENVLIVPIQTDEVANNFRTYQQGFLKNSNVLSISRSTYVPGDLPNQNMYETEDGKDQLPLWNMEVDYDLFETLGIEMAEGRSFTKEMESDSSLLFILNETAVKNYSMETPIGTRLGVLISPTERLFGTVIGVVKDFHIEGFNQPIRPMIFTVRNRLFFASIKISSENTQETIDFIEQKWNEMEPTHPFRYELLDEKFGALYKAQDNFGIIFLYLTILAIIIAAMGLYGLTSFTTEQRTKEIGVRKVLGATIIQIMNLLTKDFVRLVLIANIFAWPITYILAKEWLKKFSYQVDITILPFLFAAVLSLLIALLTVSYQAYMAANSDPVEALKYE